MKLIGDTHDATLKSMIIEFKYWAITSWLVYFLNEATMIEKRVISISY